MNTLAAPKVKKTWFRMFCEIFDLDYVRQPRMAERGKIEKKWFRARIRISFTGMSYFEILDMLTISTPKGTVAISVSHSVYDCTEVGDHLPTEVRISRFFPEDRLFLRICRE